jgi:menaquinone-specific isochorismate synthase
MEPARGDEASTHAPSSLAVRTAGIGDVSIRAFLDAAEGFATEGADAGSRPVETPRIVWRTPESGFIAAVGASAVCAADGSDRFASIREQGAELFAALEAHPDPDSGFEGPSVSRPRLFGGFSFLADTHEGSWAGTADARFVLPETQLISTEQGTWLTVTGDRHTIDSDLYDRRDRLASATEPGFRTSPTIEHAERTTSRAAWYDQVDLALSRIDAGTLEKVVLAQSLSVALDRPVSVPETLSRLAGSYPDCFVFSFPPGEGSREFFGATPERLVSVRGREIETGALAGSVERGATDAEDDRLTEVLADSEKNNHEHSLVVDAIRERLEPLSKSVTLSERRIRKLATVQHLYTPIEAELAGEEHVLSLVEALHPTPAVGGLPPKEAAETIRAIETFDRGWYAAPVGWFDAAGDGSFAVAIRSAVTEGENAALFAGNGIVAGSDPAEEWEEVQLKYRPVLDALGL